jgi:hypothetical protein
LRGKTAIGSPSKQRNENEKNTYMNERYEKPEQQTGERPYQLSKTSGEMFSLLVHIAKTNAALGMKNCGREKDR